MRSSRSAPIRVRLVAGFVTAMLVLLGGAAAFVFWRVQVALDAGIGSTLATQAATLQEALRRQPGDPRAALATLGDPEYQVLDATGRVLASTASSGPTALLPSVDVKAASTGRVLVDRGRLLFDGKRRTRVLAFPVDVGGGAPVVAVTAVRLAQHDEALRELLGQLAVANLAALVIASAVGYRLARAALHPVELYRVQAQRITAGDYAVRLDVPDHPDDEVTRLGRTLNEMLAAQAVAAERLHRFVADASHELRTPLALLTTEVELALRRPRTVAEYQQSLAEIAHVTDRLATLADQLLQLEAPPLSAGEQAWVGEAVRRAAVRQHAGEVSWTADDDLRVALSPATLDLVLGNLVDNAARHGAAPFTVSAERAEAVVRILVSDGGTGPSRDVVPEAILRFRRGDVARTTPGSGLGLSLVHEAVVASGGELRMCAGGQHHVYAPEQFDLPCAHGDVGTTVTVLLPAASDI